MTKLREEAPTFSTARAIQDQLLKDFAARSEFSDWFSRDDDVPKEPVVLMPNPRNIELDEKMAQLEIKIKRSVIQGEYVLLRLLTFMPRLQ